MNNKTLCRSGVTTHNWRDPATGIQNDCFNDYFNQQPSWVQYLTIHVQVTFIILVFQTQKYKLVMELPCHKTPCSHACCLSLGWCAKVIVTNVRTVGKVLTGSLSPYANSMVTEWSEMQLWRRWSANRWGGPQEGIHSRDLYKRRK